MDGLSLVNIGVGGFIGVLVMIGIDF